MIRSAREGVPDEAVNIHATAVVLDEGAVLVTGRAGAGKTSLALALLERWHTGDRFARLLSDDQVFVAPLARRLQPFAPATIAGLVAIRGGGIVRMPFVPRAFVDLVVDFGGGAVPAGTHETVLLAGVEVPLLHVDRARRERAPDAVAAALATIRSGDSRANRADWIDPDNDLGLPSRERRTT